MNIFFLDYEPKVCARFHCDQNIVSQCKEYCQLLSTAHRVLDGYPVRVTSVKELNGYYKPKKTFTTYLFEDPEDYRQNIMKSTHENTPVARWVMRSDANYYWLLSLWYHTLIEFEDRFHKPHKSFEHWRELSVAPLRIPFTKGITNPVLTMPDTYKQSCPIEAYRDYYRFDKPWASWRKSKIPSWFNKNNKVVSIARVRV